MTVPSKNFTIIADSAIDADSPITADLEEDFRDNDIHLEEWLGKDYVAAQNHDHDGVNSKSVLGSVFKDADEIVTSSTAFQNDDDLLFPVLANQKYYFDMVLQLGLLETSDFKFKINLPSETGTNRLAYFWQGVNRGSAYGASLTCVIGVNGAYGLRISGAFEIDSTPGNFQLQWAQDTSQGNNTTVYRSSCINYKIIE